jgi:UDP-glucuronate 4-epimerase
MSEGPSLRGAKVLVTGVTGNLGRPVATALAGANDVWGVARFSDATARVALEAAGVHCVPRDLGADPLDSLPPDFDCVFHAASLIPMVSERDMAQTFAVNTQATGEVFAHCREARTFVFCSSAGVYRHQPRPLVEEDEYGADVPAYAMSKIAAEHLVIALSSLWETPAVILRVGALYGPEGGTGGATAPIDRMVQGKEIWVNPSEPRGVSLLWEADAVRLAIRALEVGQVPPLVVNMAGEQQVTVEEYCAFAGKQLNVRPRVRYTEEAYPANPLDTTRMHEVLGRCATDWRDGMRTFLRQRYKGLMKATDQ